MQFHIVNTKSSNVCMKCRTCLSYQSSFNQIDRIESKLLTNYVELIGLLIRLKCFWFLIRNEWVNAESSTIMFLVCFGCCVTDLTCTRFMTYACIIANYAGLFFPLYWNHFTYRSFTSCAAHEIDFYRIFAIMTGIRIYIYIFIV